MADERDNFTPAKPAEIKAPVGRPRNEVKYKRQIAKATDIMGKMLPEAATATVDLATGAWVILIENARGEWVKPASQKVMDANIAEGTFRVYRELPDMKAIIVMFERLMGKVVQPVDVTVRQAVAEVTDAQAILMRIIEEHVPDAYLEPIRAELARVAEHHHQARTAVGIE